MELGFLRSILQFEVELYQPIGTDMVLAKNWIVKDRMGLQFECEGRDILHTHCGPCHVNDSAARIQPHAFDRDAGRNGLFETGEKLCPRKISFRQQLIRQRHFSGQLPQGRLGQVDAFSTRVTNQLLIMQAGLIETGLNLVQIMECKEGLNCTHRNPYSKTESCPQQ